MQRLRAKLAPYFLILPGGLWLAIFFIIPTVTMLSFSLMTGNEADGYQLTWHFQNYTDALSTYWPQFLRSLEYGATATILGIALSYPIAYWIAFKGGKRKSTYLFLVLLPFFVSFVLRTISWQFFLSDNGLLLSPLKSMGLVPQDFHILQTTVAVVLGLTYNYLPFIVLPLYVALERVDPRVVEASSDLYAGRIATFTKVIFPLSLPGVFAGVIMNFVPAASDYVNAEILGGPNNTMIGSIIQDQALHVRDYPTATALSTVLMGGLLVGIFLYARALGTEDVLEAAAR
ncbi:MAG TPA: ABC transporter permease [Streptosporangiaceae bacterium]|nr:ABC transporter permease [Streptosporangiaceae bacterium]